MNSCFCIGYKGNIEAYIYIWFSKENGLVYVGETNNKNGVIGRANQHVQKGGTLYERCYEKGYELNEINDFILLSFPLPREKRFLSEDTGYRISVEYLVQHNLIEMNNQANKKYKIVSNIQTGPYTNLNKIKKIAEEISEKFINIYNEN